ncbi:hypothetical protein [Rhizobium sp. BK176]|uniref:hypothetical protein n=1 Tax=Rhizobium sp. BK176 TaxID=2587071 RepID=UPI0021688260|nr:hypothetical protein [Rhizobium sp. BK176]MCS4088863.1 hypothetical protein [Rhizobium sp. BK176]
MRTGLGISKLRCVRFLAGQARLAASGLAQGIDAPTAQLQAIFQLSSLIERNALVMTYSDCFWLMGVLILAMTPVVLLLRRPKNGGAGEALSAGH